MLPGVRGMWDNGGRGLLLAFIFFAIAIAILLAATVALLLRDALAGTYEPLYGFTDPQTVLTPKVVVGESVRVTATKCSSEDVALVGENSWRRISGDVVIITGGRGSKPFPAGCKTSTFENVPPAGVGTGTWVIEGTNTVSQGSETQVVGWQTEPFEVVDAVTIDTPWKVLTPSVPVGGTVSVLVTACNNTGADIVTTSEGAWQSVSTPIVLIATPGGTLTYKPGCIATGYNLTLPPGVTPGTWFRAGVITLPDGTDIPHHSQSFTVTAP